MPSRFSTATAITSTPRVIHVSTSSFCFAGSGSVGPSHSNLRPSSLAASSAPLRQEMKYALPLLFGIMAMVNCLWPAPGPGALSDLPHPLVKAQTSATQATRYNQFRFILLLASQWDFHGPFADRKAFSAQLHRSISPAEVLP